MPVYDRLVGALSRVSECVALDLRRVQEALGDLRDVNLYHLRTEVPDVPDVAASDSSRVTKSYSMAVVFAVQAVGLRVSHARPSSSGLVAEAEAGYYLPSPWAGDAAGELLRRVLQYVSKTLEVSVLAEASEGAEVALLDGSIFSFLWYWRSRLREIPGSLRFSGDRPRRLRDIWREIVSGLARLPKAGTVPVFVAKTIMRSYYVGRLLGGEASSRLGGRVNDLVLLYALRACGRLPRGVYILEPVHISSIHEMPRPLNALDPEDSRYLEPLVPVTVTYVSLSPAAQLYQVTLPGKWSAEELVELLSRLYPYSHGGYPDPLRLAHRYSKLSSEEFRYLLLRLGLSSLPTGREPLGEVG